jgi:predicted DNA-binding protein (MmcQ/YjbR family)
MNVESLREILLEQPHATEETPFGPEHLVYKIAGHKLFAILSPEEVPARVNLKCDPDRALDLRDRHEAIEPGYHMNKKHWNTVVLDGSLPAKLIRSMARDSWQLVFDGLPAKVRNGLAR